MLINTIIISLIVIFLNIDIVHARSRAPAWSCYWSCFFTRKNLLQHFMAHIASKTILKNIIIV